MSKLSQTILESYTNGTFFDTLFDEVIKSSDHGNAVADTILNLHNAGELDLIAAYRNMQLAPSHRGAFTVIYTLSKILPDLDYQIEPLMDCMEYLFDGGHEIHFLNTPFFTFCGKSEGRCSSVLKHLQREHKDKFDFLAAGLISGSKFDLEKYAHIAMDIIISRDITEKEIAVRALGRMPFQTTSPIIDEVFSFLLSITELINSFILVPTTLHALHSLYLIDKSKEARLIQFIENHSDTPTSEIIKSASEILFLKGSESSDQVEDALFAIVTKLSHDNYRAIDNIDYALKRLVLGGDLEKPIQILEKILMDNREIRIDQFDDLCRLLLDDKDEYLSKIVTKWLLSNDLRKELICFHLLQNQGTSGLELSYDLSQLTGNFSYHHLFLAEKACAWFFSSPLSAISLVSSLIASASKDQIDEIRYIVFSTILISYPGTVGDYLKVKKKDGGRKLKSFCKALLDELAEYHKLLELSFGIKELRPSLEDRLKSAKHTQALNVEAMKKAQKNSLFADLFPHKVVLLYGNRSIYFSHIGDQKIRQEVPLTKFSTSIEYPSLDIVNPHKLELLLQHLRLKRITD